MQRGHGFDRAGEKNYDRNVTKEREKQKRDATNLADASWDKKRLTLEMHGCECLKPGFMIKEGRDSAKSDQHWRCTDVNAWSQVSWWRKDATVKKATSTGDARMWTLEARFHDEGRTRQCKKPSAQKDAGVWHSLTTLSFTVTKLEASGGDGRNCWLGASVSIALVLSPFGSSLFSVSHFFLSLKQLKIGEIIWEFLVLLLLLLLLLNQQTRELISARKMSQ